MIWILVKKTLYLLPYKKKAVCAVCRNTLKPPELQNNCAALQVVQQALGGPQGGEVSSVIQQGVDVVPHSWGVQRLAAVKQLETTR